MQLRQAREERGFTLLELMVVVVVLTIVTMATFTGVHRDTFESSYRIFTDDVHGIVGRARNAAVDFATISKLEISRDRVEHEWVDPIAGTWRPGSILWVNTENSVLGENACIAGVYDGVQAPGMPAVLNELPAECMTETKELRFFPDGRFEYTDSAVGGAGVTIVIGDFRNESSPLYTLIEIYPGGMVRKLDNVVSE